MLVHSVPGTWYLRRYTGIHAAATSLWTKHAEFHPLMFFYVFHAGLTCLIYDTCV